MSQANERLVLSRDRIAGTAMRLTLEEPTTPLTLVRLGLELDADPTAMYRHYRNRDELILDLGDRLLQEAVERTLIDDDWLGSLANAARTTRLVFLTRPALAAEVGTRFTGGPGEQAAAKLIDSIMESAGFTGEAAVANTRAFGDLLMGHIVSTAAYLSLPDATQASDGAIAQRLYGPAAGAPADQTGEVFDLILSTYLAGLGRKVGNQSLDH